MSVAQCRANLCHSLATNIFSFDVVKIYEIGSPRTDIEEEEGEKRKSRPASREQMLYIKLGSIQVDVL